MQLVNGNSRYRYGVLAGAAIVLGLVALLWPKAGRSSFPPLPVPNGYDALVTAAGRIIRATNSLRQMSNAELDVLVSSNESSLKEIRAALSLPSAVPVQFREDWMTTQAGNMVILKAAALAMEVEVELRQRQGDIAGALAESVDLVKFGQAIARHGVLISCMVGTACEAMGVRRMTNLLDRASAADCRRVVSALEDQDQRREPFQEIMEHEREWIRRSFGSLAQFSALVLERITGKPLSISLNGQPPHECTARLREQRLLILRYARRAFVLERQRQPKSAAELLPGFLHALPLDPVTLKPLELPIANEQ